MPFYPSTKMGFKRCRVRRTLNILMFLSVLTAILMVYTLLQNTTAASVLKRRSTQNMLMEDIQMDLADTGSHISHRKQTAMSLYLKFLGNNLTSEEIERIQEYYIPRKTRVNPVKYSFIGNYSDSCDSNSPPFLIITCISKPVNVIRRNAIRHTWGQAGVLGSLRVKLVFVIGESTSAGISDQVTTEGRHHHDIVSINLQDTYRNLTYKVMMAMKWSMTFCPGAKFFMKVDDDCFIHVPNAVRMLMDLPVPRHGIVVGSVNFNHHVQRGNSKWRMTRQEFPFSKMPLYASGQTYIISGNIINLLFDAGEHMPYVPIEDGYITGVLRTVIGASIKPMSGFPSVMMAPAGPCSFHSKDRIAATNITPEQMMKIWKKLNDSMDKCKV